MAAAVKPSTNLLRRLSILTLAITCVAVGIYTWRVSVSEERLRSDALRQLELRAAQTSAAIASQQEATIRTVDFALLQLRGDYQDHKTIGSQARAVFESFPANAITQIGVIDTEGYLVWSSAAPGSHVYLGDRDHFKAHLDTDKDRLFISAPVLGRASGAWSIQFSRALWRNGRFAGVIVISVSPQYLIRGHEMLRLGPRDVVAVFRSGSGHYLARIPDLMDSLGRTAPPNRPLVALDAPATGVFRASAAFDEVRRTYAWTRLADYPVVVALGLDEAVALEPVEREINRSILRAGIGSLLVLVLASGVAFLLIQAASQQAEMLASEARHRAFFERNTSVKLLVDPADGRILDANPAAVAFYGYGREALLAMRITDINCLPPDEVKAEMECARTEQRLYFNFRHRLASGAMRDVEVYSGPVEVDGRQLLFSIVHDVTARHELAQRLAASEELHRSLFETMAEGAIVVTRNGHIAGWNPASLAILGVDVEGLRNRKARIFDAEGTPLPAADFPTMRSARGEQLDHALYGVERPDGKRAWVTVSSRRLEHAGTYGEGAAVLSFSDITPLVEAEESLRLAQSVFEVAGEGIMVTDEDNRIIAVNPAFSEVTGYGATEVIGQKPSLLASGLHDAEFYAGMWKRLARDGHWEGEISNRRKDGRIYVEWLRITIVRERPGHGRRYVALFSDITDRKREAEAVWRQANFDALTALPNRKLLEDRLKRAIAQAHRKHTTVALLFIDLDRFKPVNDVFGHAAGDELLRQVARRLEHSLRDEDTVARIGGDEFVAVLPDLRVAEAPARAAEKIVAVLSEPFRIGEHFVEISCSIGVALFPKHADNADGLVAAADRAMYAAKEAGRSTWRMA